jgi:hypothetical protein
MGLFSSSRRRAGHRAHGLDSLSELEDFLWALVNVFGPVVANDEIVACPIEAALERVGRMT